MEEWESSAAGQSICYLTKPIFCHFALTALRQESAQMGGGGGGTKKIKNIDVHNLEF